MDRTEILLEPGLGRFVTWPDARPAGARVEISYIPNQSTDTTEVSVLIVAITQICLGLGRNQTWVVRGVNPPDCG